jgi:hypothetical protein
MTRFPPTIHRSVLTPTQSAQTIRQSHVHETDDRGRVIATRGPVDYANTRAVGAV